MITSRRCAPKSNFVKMGSVDVSGEMSKISLFVTYLYYENQNSYTSHYI